MTTTSTNTTRRPGRPANVSGGQAPALTTEQVKTLLRVTATGPNGTRNVALLHMLLSGCRVGEPLQVTRGQVLVGGKVAESFTLGAATTKTKKARRVYLSATARRALSAWLDQQNSHDENDRIFPLNRDYAQQLVASLMKTAGIKGSSHSLRRTCATMLSDSGVNVVTISEVLGHSDISTTSIYLARNTANVAKAINNNLPW